MQRRCLPALFAPVATSELATMATLKAKLTMPGGDGGADEAMQAAKEVGSGCAEGEVGNDGGMRLAAKGWRVTGTPARTHVASLFGKGKGGDGGGRNRGEVQTVVKMRLRWRCAAVGGVGSD